MLENFNFSFLEEQILKSSKILILTHQDPDGDAIGSLMAVKTILKEMGKDSDISLTGKMASGIYINEKITPPKSINIQNYDLIIILDTNNPHRTGIEFPNDLSLLPTTFIIDHHLKREDQECPLNVHCLILPKATATCEIIYDLLKNANKEISPQTAHCLLLGIYTDSGGFVHSNTTPQLFKKTKELLQKGVFLKNITRFTLGEKNVNVLNLLGRKLNESKFNPKLKYVYTHINQNELEKENVSIEEVGGLSSLLNMCQEARFSLSLLELKSGRIKGSLRSTDDKNMNVSVISRLLGGGGHKLAAGFEVKGKIVDKDGKLFIKPLE